MIIIFNLLSQYLIFQYQFYQKKKKMKTLKTVTNPTLYNLAYIFITRIKIHTKIFNIIILKISLNQMKSINAIKGLLIK